MPIVDVFGSGDLLGVAKADWEFLVKLVADELTVNEWPIDESHISLRFLEGEGRQIGEIEVIMSAHRFVERAKNKDNICSRIRLILEARWGVEVRVWLQLFDMGYGLRDGKGEL